MSELNLCFGYSHRWSVPAVLYAWPMARKPTLSPSRITTFLACPLKYYWTYLDARGRYYLRAKSHYSFGSTLHKVLQRFHDAGDTGVTTVSEALAAVEESWIDAGYSSAQEMQEALGEGKELVETYVTENLKAPSPGRPILIEKRLQMDMGAFNLLGIVDRVDEYPDGSLEIIDYKSGRQSVSPEDIQYDLAMSCYQLLVRHHYPDRPVKATIIALRSNSRASFALADADALQFEADLRVLGQQILATEFDSVAPSVKELCRRCDFLSLCRQDHRWDTRAFSEMMLEPEITA